MKTIGFIGCGHIAKSLITGLKKNSDYKIVGYDKIKDSLDWLKANNCTPLPLKDVALLQKFYSYVSNLKICLHYVRNYLEK